MKKIATILLIVVLSLSGLARTVENTFSFNTYGLFLGGTNEVRLCLSDGSFVGSQDGYIASIWYGGTADAPMTLVPFQAMVLFDIVVEQVYGYPEMAVDFAGLIQWQSDPEKFDMSPNTEYTFALRIFHAQDLVNLFNPLWDYGDGSGLVDNEWSKIAASPELVQSAWDKALENWRTGATDYEIGEFIYTATTNSDNQMPGVSEKFNTFASTATDGKLYLVQNDYRGDPIPEPSTWLLLGAGMAFAFIMRRRKESV